MKKNSSIYSLFLHHGISVVLLGMMVTIYFILKMITIQNKATADVLYCSQTEKYITYVERNDLFSPKVGGIIQIETSDRTSLSFEVIKIKEEVSFVVLTISPKTDENILMKSFGGNTKLSGYVFINNIQLSDLIFNKWYNLKQ